MIRLCDAYERGHLTEPCETWTTGCTHREQAVRCSHCYGTDTWNDSGRCDACELSTDPMERARRETSRLPLGIGPSDPSETTGKHDRPSLRLCPVPPVPVVSVPPGGDAA